MTGGVSIDNDQVVEAVMLADDGLGDVIVRVYVPQRPEPRRC